MKKFLEIVSKRIKKFFDFVYLFFLTLCKLFFIITVVMTAYLVFGRFVLHSQPVWGEEIVLLSITYMALISAALAIRDDSHMKMTVIEFIVPPKAVNVLKFVALIVIFIFALFMVIDGFEFAEIMKLSKLTGLQIETSWLYLAVPVSGIAIMLMVLEKFLETFGLIPKTKSKAEIDEENNRLSGKQAAREKL